jgi:tRNA threonylcarbamoyl adenosine modification protein YjeE
MPSKKSKHSANPPCLWKAEPNCSEDQLDQVSSELSKQLIAGDRVILEGAMGAGKSTFARLLLKNLGIDQPAEGSPTFAIAHEYTARGVEVIHMDLYRLKSEAELEEAGIPTYFWDRECISLTEWLSQFPEFEASVLKPQARLTRPDEMKVNWLVKLGFHPESDSRRSIEIFKV